MKILKLLHYSNSLLRGKRTITALICFMPIAAWIFFRSAEACFYAMFLYFSEKAPMSLFDGSIPLQIAVTAGFTIVRWTVTAPLVYICAYRLCEICSEKNSPLTPLTEVLTEKGSVRRSISALIWTKIFSLAALIPAAFFAVAAYDIFNSRHSTSGLFMTLHAVTLTVVSVIMWLSLKLSFTAVPFLLTKYPERSPLRNVLYSLRFMRGRRSVFLKLSLICLPAIMSVAAAPFVLPLLCTSFALSVDIFIKEEEYLERTETESLHERVHNSPELPSGAERSLKKTADTSETSDQRNNQRRHPDKKHRYRLSRRRNNPQI